MQVARHQRGSSAGRWLLAPLIWLCLADRTASRFFGFGTTPTTPPHVNVASAPVGPRDFQIYWNIPTFMCHKYGMDFDQVGRKFGILQNERDKFRGDKIAILYDPGDFPALLKDNTGDKYVRRNGGVPQEGNLTLHLDYMRRHLDEQIPDANFSGIGVIDFESWRPIFRQNWASLQIYRDLSIDLERQRHPFWSQRAIQREATERFEQFGRVFMQRTLEVVKKLRPKAVWGYYAYPYCFNWTPNQQSAQCSAKVVEENDEMSWLFANEKILLPSVYLQQRLSASQRVGLVRGRVQEAVRLARKSRDPDVRVYAYYWYRYQDQRDLFVDKRDLENTIGEVARRGADGLILWGSSSDLDSKRKCEAFQNYLQQTFGPELQRLERRIEEGAYAGRSLEEDDER